MIRLPVSLGEAIDKLTILNIKCEKITNPEKRAFCVCERDILSGELTSLMPTYNHLYNWLYIINTEIWDIQDEIRDNPDTNKCMSIIYKNDMRFNIKDRINKISAGIIREQKGYKKRRALFIGHLGLGDQIGLIGAIRYIAIQHDETVVIVYKHNLANMKSFFSDDSSIIFWTVESGYIVHPTERNAGELIKYDTSEFNTVYKSGFYILPNNGFENLPIPFYLDMKISPSIRHAFFHIPASQQGEELYNLISNMQYIIVQQQSSSSFCKLMSWDINTIFTIDPNLNVYSPDHTWYILASKFVNRPMIEYIETMKHASEIHTVDSSFYCLACYIPLEATVKRCYNRSTGAYIEELNFT